MLDRPSSRFGLDLESNWRCALDRRSRNGRVVAGVEPRPTVVATGRGTWKHPSMEQRCQQHLQRHAGRRRRRAGRVRAARAVSWGILEPENRMTEWERLDGWASNGAQGRIFACARRPSGNAARETLNSAAVAARAREHGGRLKNLRWIQIVSAVTSVSA
jgi:hypothetical protein